MRFRRRRHGLYVANNGGSSGARVLFADTFNRTDSATTLGTAYTVAGSLTFGIQSGKAYTVDPGVVAAGQATHDCGQADVDMTCDVTLRPSNNTDRGAPAVRSDGTEANRWIVLMNSTGWASLRLVRYVSGTGTDVATGSFAPTVGTVYTVRVVAKGSAWEVFVNGTSVITATDDTHNDLTYCGIFATRTANANSTPTFDNLVVRAA